MLCVVLCSLVAVCVLDHIIVVVALVFVVIVMVVVAKAVVVVVARERQMGSGQMGSGQMGSAEIAPNTTSAPPKMPKCKKLRSAQSIHATKNK